MNTKVLSPFRPLAERGDYIRILLWESWRRGMPWCAVAFCGVCSLAAILYNSVLRAGSYDPVAARSLHIFFLWTQFACFGGAAYAVQQSPARLYLCPISTKSLVAWTMLVGLLVTSGMSLAAGTWINWQFGIAEPVLGPALFMGCALVLLESAYWATKNTGLVRPVACAAIAVMLKFWLDARTGGGPLTHTIRRWDGVTAPDLAGFAGITLAAYFLTVFGISRDRRGDCDARSLGIACLFRRCRAGAPVRSSEIRPFRSAAAAQFWFEWRQSGRVMPGLFGFFLAFLGVSYFARWFDNRDYELLHISIGAAIGILPVAAVVGLVVAHRDSNRGRVECGSFLATLPMSSSAQSFALLKMSAVSLLALTGLLAAALTFSTAWLFAAEGVAPVMDLWTHHGDLTALVEKLGYGWGVLAVGLLWIGAWATLTLGASLALTGRQALVNGGLVGCLTILIAHLAFSEALPEGTARVFCETASALFGTAALLGTGCLYAIAWRRQFINSRTAGAAGAAWVGLSLLSCLLKAAIGMVTPSFLVFVTGLSALPLAALAAAPLAFSWNRHR